MDRIEILGVRVYGRHGANPGERDVPQPFDVDVRLELDLGAARRSDALADTIDYAAVQGVVTAIVRERSYALLERLGQEVLDALLADARVGRAAVRIAKPGLLGGATPAVTVRGERARARSRHVAYIGLGANLGDAPATLREAARRLARLGAVGARSSLYRTPAWGYREQPDFVNAAVALETELEPHALLDGLKSLERELGRVPSVRWGPRAIDLDILAFDDVRLAEPDLVIPHAHLGERAFALVPLAEIAPAYAPLRDALPPAELAAVARIGPFEREPVER